MRKVWVVEVILDEAREEWEPAFASISRRLAEEKLALGVRRGLRARLISYVPDKPAVRP